MIPDLIVLADTVHTMDGGHSDPIQAVAVRAGVVAAVGSRLEAQDWAQDGTRVVDLGSATLTPGLVDCHMHPVFGLDLTIGVDLSGAAGLEDVRTLLASESRNDDAWLRGWGLNPNAFGEVPLHRSVLDDVSGDKPALIRLFDGHSALANSRALEAAGIHGPCGFEQAAEVVCDGDGVPTGLLLEAAAMELVQRHIPQEPFSERKARLADLLRDFARSGLTGGHVMDHSEESSALFQALEADGELPLRLRSAPWCMPGSDETEWKRLARTMGTGGRRWSVETIKLFVDGTVDNGTAWLYEPDTLGQSTAPFWPRPEEYAAAVRYFAARGIPTATHAIGDAGVEYVLDALESLRGDVPADILRGTVHRIEHLETVPDGLVERFKGTGIVASMQPTHCTHYSLADQSDNWSTRLGKERADRAWRCRDLREAGVTLGIGSDWPIAPFEPLPIIADAQLRRRSGHPGEEPIAPAQALTALQALEGYTSHAAKAAGLWEVSGSITVGKRADFTAFDLNPLTTDPDEFAASAVLGTFVDGEIQFMLDRTA
ncbi:putative amidohydrolase YtcJ [Paenarthrobacter nitroguajacolicus]|uniref:amidohydrolase n=1 Tax=Paenarthrobacter nitroguajacolicus TaxID=211146 RepID=UPI0028628931|nr:amidohydrolase family protein [Paenarthrobacter nitroguajacolicus]MDR6987389.1 putative amidohydrolase YtcJ [Paenarthrobacter nitroguajacolicus]